jgi:hypothetical protein
MRWRGESSPTVLVWLMRALLRRRAALAGPTFGNATSKSMTFAVDTCSGGAAKIGPRGVFPFRSSCFSCARATLISFARFSALLRCSGELARAGEGAIGRCMRLCLTTRGRRARFCQPSIFEHPDARTRPSHAGAHVDIRVKAQQCCGKVRTGQTGAAHPEERNPKLLRSAQALVQIRETQMSPS